jgi:hypothetical protein
MLTLDAELYIPAHVSYSIVGEDAFLLNTRTNKYYILEEVGTRIWNMLKSGESLRKIYKALLVEFEVEPSQLEQDILELIVNMNENGIVEVNQV